MRTRGFGGPGRGGRGPRARRGDVRAAVLALLADRPMHGYEMIKEIEERSEGAWTPSAGSIYPMLQLLEDEGLIRGEETDGKRRFTLTDEGRKEQDEKSGDVTPWDAVRAGVPTGHLQLRGSVHQLLSAVKAVAAAATRTSRSRSASCSTTPAARSTGSSPRAPRTRAPTRTSRRPGSRRAWRTREARLRPPMRLATRAA